jgi:hypothetical protein
MGTKTELQAAWEVRKEMDKTIVNLPFTETEVVILGTAGYLMDGRNSMAKMLRKHFTPRIGAILKRRNA